MMSSLPQSQFNLANATYASAAPPMHLNSHAVPLVPYGPYSDMHSIISNQSLNGYDDSTIYDYSQFAAPVPLADNQTTYNSALTPPSSVSYYPDSGMMANNVAAYYHNASIFPPYTHYNGLNQMTSQVLLPANNLNNFSNINAENTLDNDGNYAKIWTGELPETSHLVNKYQCRFRINAEMFSELKNDLMRLFRGNIHIVDTFPSQNSPSPYYLITYFKSEHFKKFTSFCRQTNDKNTILEFVHPEKNYRLEVCIKPLSLPYDLRYRAKYARLPSGQLYVEGLSSLFTAKDLFKIYDDLYANIVSVRIFNDKNGLPHNSALVVFKHLSSYNKALRESPIIVRTSSFKAKLFNKVYNKDRQYKQPQRHAYNRNSDLPATDQKPLNNYNNSNGHLTQHSLQSLSPSTDNTASRNSSFDVDFNKYSKNKRPYHICKIRRDALKGSSDKYLTMKTEYKLYSKMKHQNYLSD